MSTKNPRLLVTLDPLLYQWVKNIADKYGISMSLAVRDIIKKEFSEERWFWTKSWQTAEHESDEDLKKGRYKDFDTVDDLLQDLHS